MNDPITAMAAKEAIDGAKAFLGEISKGATGAVGGLIADQVNYWRFKNKVNLLLKAREFLKHKAIKPEKILPDVFVPLLEDAANTEDETLSKMFASLLTSHLDPATQNKIHPSFAKILAQLSPLDARIIADMYRGLLTQNLGWRAHGFSIENVCQGFQIAQDTALVSFQNLWRLGVCDHGSDALALLNQVKQISFTDYGWSFAAACLSHT